MPIHEKKECPNRIITSSNIGITNLVKETLPPTPYIKPPFAFPTPKEKHKCISTSARMEKKFKIKFRVHADGTSVRADTLTRPRGRGNLLFLIKNKIPCLRKWSFTVRGRGKNPSAGKILPGGIKMGGQGRPDDENRRMDEMDVRTVSFTQKRLL
jgi:hypothetical protein